MTGPASGQVAPQSVLSSAHINDMLGNYTLHWLKYLLGKMPTAKLLLQGLTGHHALQGQAGMNEQANEQPNKQKQIFR